MADLIPDDSALAALSDDALLAMLDAHGIDASAIGDREGAIDALKLKRDTPPEQGGEQAPPPAPPAPENQQADPEVPPVEEPEDGQQASLELDTRADVDQPQRFERPRFSAMVNDAVRAAAGNPALHAVLHNFEVALADFRRTADLVGDDPALDQESDVADLVRDIRRFF